MMFTLLKVVIRLLISTIFVHFCDKYDKESGERYIAPDIIKDDLQKLYSIIKSSMIVTLLFLAILVSVGVTELNEKQYIRYILYVNNALAIPVIWWFVKYGKNPKKEKERKRGLIEEIILKEMLPIYEYDGQFGRYFLREEFVTIRDLVYCLRWMAISAFAIVYELDFLTEGGQAAYVYPVFVVISIHEIYRYLSGWSKEEYCKLYYNLEEEEMEETPIVGLYHALKGEVEEGELIEWGERKEGITYKNSVDNSEAEDSERQLLMKFLVGKDYAPYKLRYLVEPTVAALKKQNIIFRTFFYRDLDFALFFPMFQRVLEGEKCLFVVDKNRKAKEIKWMRKKFEEMCGIYDFVCIKEMREAKELDDIIVLGYDEIEQFAESKLFQTIADRLGTIFMLEPSKQIPCDLKEVKRIKKDAEETGGNPNIIIVDSRKELAEKIIFLKGDDMVYWGAYGMHPRQSIVVCWSADFAREDKEIIELRVIQALQKKMTSGEIVWIYGDKRAAEDIWWQFRYEKGEPAGCPVTLKKDGKELALKKEACFIIEDTEFNYNRVSEQYLTRAEEKALINIISPNYLLRDFMISNQEDKDIRKILSKTISPEPGGQENEDRNKGYSNIFQKYLPGEYIVKNGMQYKISRIKEGKDGSYEIQKTPVMNSGGSRIYYRQDRNYELKGMCDKESAPPKSVWRTEKIEMFLENADVTGTTYGYLEMPEFNNLYYAHKIKLSENIPKREYKNKQYIRWVLKGADDNVLAYFAAILKEMLYTICPQLIDFINLCIICYGEDRKTLLEKLSGVVAEVNIENLNDKEASVYLIEDNKYESGLIQALVKHWNVIYRLMDMYVKWSIENECRYLTYGNGDEAENIQNILKNMEKYLAQDLKATGDEEGDEIKKEFETEKQEHDEHFEVKTEEEAKRIFADVLLDMFYFEAQHVNIPLNPVFREKDIQKGEVKLKLNVDYKTFYRECAYGILLAYYQWAGDDMDKAEHLSREYAQKYIELVYSK